MQNQPTRWSTEDRFSLVFNFRSTISALNLIYIIDFLTDGPQKESIWSTKITEKVRFGGPRVVHFDTLVACGQTLLVSGTLGKKTL